MQWRSTTEDWGAVAKFIHWAMAASFMLMIIVGVTMRWFLGSDVVLQFRAYQLHKSFGFTLLVFAVARLLWRLSAKAIPVPPDTLKPHERRLANAVHVALYIAMFGMPISGLLATSASPLNVPTVIFGLFTLPRPIGPDAALATFFSAIHLCLACLLVASVTLHVAGAIWHMTVLRDGVLQRMAPRRRGDLSAANSPKGRRSLS